jgi:hypothetical protein
MMQEVVVEEVVVEMVAQEMMAVVVEIVEEVQHPVELDQASANV